MSHKNLIIPCSVVIHKRRKNISTEVCFNILNGENSPWKSLCLDKTKKIKKLNEKWHNLIKDVLPERENPSLPISKLEQSQIDKKILRWTSSLGELCETLEKDKQSEWIPNIILSVIYKRISKKQRQHAFLKCNGACEWSLDSFKGDGLYNEEYFEYLEGPLIDLGVNNFCNKYGSRKYIDSLIHAIQAYPHHINLWDIWKSLKGVIIVSN